MKQIGEGHVESTDQPRLFVYVTSFGMRNGLPRQTGLVFDVRFLANPHYDPDLGPLTGNDERVRRFILGDHALEPFLDNLTTSLALLLDSRAGGKAPEIADGGTDTPRGPE